MDINNLLNINKLKEQKQIIFIIVVILVTAFVGKKIWDGQKNKVSNISLEIKNYQEVIKLSESINRLSEGFDQFKDKGWLTEDSVAIMGEVNNLASKHGIEIITFDPASIEKLESYSTLKLNLNIRAEYFALVRFLLELEELKTLTKISTLLIIPEGDSGKEEGPMARANLTIVAFIIEKR